MMHASYNKNERGETLRQSKNSYQEAKNEYYDIYCKNIPGQHSNTSKVLKSLSGKAGDNYHLNQLASPLPLDYSSYTQEY